MEKINNPSLTPESINLETHKNSIRMTFKNPIIFAEKNGIKNIPQIFEDWRLPEWFTNNIAYWWWNMSDEEINETLPDWTRKFTHLEMDFGSTKCKMLCPHCFKSQIEQHKKSEMKWMSIDELKNMITEKFKPLWLKTIKMCGPWEPFQNSELLPFLKWAHDEWIWVSIFTKWYEIWDDKEIERIYGWYWIHTSEELANKLKELDVSILIWLNSFDPQKQKEYVWHWKGNFWERYLKAQKKAIINLINAWLNEYIPWQPTRLWISFAPMKPETLNDAYELYEWARMRNIYPLWCPSNDSWDWKKENERVESNFDSYENMLLNFYIKVYIWNIEHWVQTLDNFLEEWPSLYPWVHVCKQTRTWWYMRLIGNGVYEMVSCPGHDPARKELKIIENIGKATKEEILESWKKSANANRWKYFCIARSWITLPTDFPHRIVEWVKEYFNIN